ncbi:hypothetical protein B566_EDAN013840, partial [Ephemera danica]
MAFANPEKSIAHLNSLDYILEFKQYDEDDLAIIDILKDLKNGVRLVRLIEILTGRSLSNKLITSPKTNKDFISNVKLAITSLKKCGYEVIDIKPGDIVSGNSVQTYSMVWQILHKFQ